MRRIKLTLVISFAVFLLCQPVFAWDDKCYIFNGSSQDLPRIIETIVNKLKTTEITVAGFPKYSKTESVGDYWRPNALKVVPVVSADLADSISLDTNKFITFKIWGLNQRAVLLADLIYLSKEDDLESVKNGMKGVKQNKHIELDYTHLLPTTESGSIGGDFSDAERIAGIIRASLLAMGSQELECH